MRIATVDPSVTTCYCLKELVDGKSSKNIRTSVETTPCTQYNIAVMKVTGDESVPRPV
jgi:hypothetical protein